MMPSRRWDWPSVAKRGSRLTGLASMRKVMAWGLKGVGREQPEKASRLSTTAPASREQRTARGRAKRDERRKRPPPVRRGATLGGRFARPCAGLARRGIGDFTEDRRAARAG